MTTVLGSKKNITSNESIDCIDIPLLKSKLINEFSIESKIWGVIGGPPCPDFSIAGKQRGADGENGVLSSVYVDAIIKLKPTFFLFENVKGLIKTAKHKKYFDSLIKRLEENNYDTDYRLLNALNYGVPQDRERVFIVGFSRDYIKEFKHGKTKDIFPWNIKRKYVDAKNEFDWESTSAFSRNPKKPKDTPEELMVMSCLTNIDTEIDNRDDFFTPKSKKFHEIDEGDTNRKSFKRLHRWRYSPTCAYGNNEVHLHPYLPRRLSAREALRIQSVPDTYNMPKETSLTAKFKVIGNGVPVKLSRGIAKAFKEVLTIGDGKRGI